MQCYFHAIGHMIWAWPTACGRAARRCKPRVDRTVAAANLRDLCVDGAERQLLEIVLGAEAHEDLASELLGGVVERSSDQHEWLL